MGDWKQLLQHRFIKYGNKKYFSELTVNYCKYEDIKQNLKTMGVFRKKIPDPQGVDFRRERR